MEIYTVITEYEPMYGGVIGVEKINAEDETEALKAAENHYGWKKTRSNGICNLPLPISARIEKETNDERL